MTRIMMAVKNLENAHTMLPVLKALRLPEPEIRLAHVIEPPGGTLGKMLLTASEGDYIAQYLNNKTFAADALLGTVAQELEQGGMRADREVSEGSPAPLLAESSAAFAADLLAISLAPAQGWSEAWLGARVARRLLLESTTSLLICRPEAPGGTAPLQHAILATDHSPYADRCVERFIALAPRGVTHVTVMTAFQGDLVSSLGPFVGQLGVDVSRWINDKLHEENTDVIRQLEAAGYVCRSEVRESTVQEAIAASLRENEAGLVVLGAQGHSFVERLAMGSVSLHETLHGSAHLLVLRN